MRLIKIDDRFYVEPQTSSEAEALVELAGAPTVTLTAPALQPTSHSRLSDHDQCTEPTE